jgi:hypothetical protein
MAIVHVSLIPIIGVVGEQKTKPTQHSVAVLRSLGLNPNLLACRCSEPLEDSVKHKLVRAPAGCCLPGWGRGRGPRGWGGVLMTARAAAAPCGGRQPVPAPHTRALCMHPGNQQHQQQAQLALGLGEQAGAAPSAGA